MTPDELRAAIAADCPHRLDDHDDHLADISQPTPAFIQLWREEHAVSSRPDLEQHLADLYAQAQDSSDYAIAKQRLEQASRIRHNIREELK